MKVLLATVPIPKKEVFGEFGFAAPLIPPIGLAYIAAMLETADHQVKILDSMLQDLTFDEILGEIRDFRPEIVGFNVYTITYNNSREFIRRIKAEFPEIRIVFGGPHVTSLPEETMRENPLLDYGVVGEGEYTMLELAEKLDPDMIQGLVHRRGDEVITNPPRPLISNLDDLPHPARHLLPSGDLYQHTPTRAVKGKTISMITSRGCPFGCLYCHQIFGKTWRPHSVDYIFEEIDSLGDRYDLISFEDDNFGLEKKRLHEFCRRKMDSHHDFKWNCYLRLDGVDDVTMDLMKRAGCNCIFFGIESGNSEILEFVEKKITLDLIKDKIRTVKRHGIHAYGSFIIGLPKETRETIGETIRLAISLPLDGITVNLFTPYPKTVLREIAADYGTLSSNWSDYNDHSPVPPFVPHGMEAEQLLALQKKAYRRFYVRPSYVLTHLDKVFDAGFVKKSLIAVKVLLDRRSTENVQRVRPG